jgi:hypothetical protein
MKKQLGMSLGGLILLLILLVFVAYTAARVVPAYMDYWTLKHVLENTLQTLGGEQLTAKGIRQRFEKELGLNNITTVAREDLVIETTESGFKLTAEYSVKQPFWREIHICMDFKAEAESK